MEVSLTNTLKEFVRAKVRSGEFSSEGAVIEAALERLPEVESLALDNLIDREFVASCDREGDEDVPLDEVLRATSKIPGSLAQSFIDEERADRS